MTATNTNTYREEAAGSRFEHSVPVMIAFAPNWKARLILARLVGAFLIFSAFSMWLMPGSIVGADVWPIKMVASMLFLIVGVSLLTIEVLDQRPDAYFDPIRREVRVLQKNEDGRPQTVLRRSYDSLGGARFEENEVHLFDVDGSLLMKLPLESADVSRALKGQLSKSVTIFG
ncbi:MULTISPECIES: hypothetical protein [Ruegeria]|jgi:hypothetical protein|uniref:Integral membrane protein n=1 Tax=Ruegeria atlantica TaxID=81569 RepID=A0ABX1W6S0_9RHOB|nr:MULTISPECIES: hypothetical protein [Ruegeria]NOD29151.1 hypothetical protein [Ruegeria atlantica]QFT73279.1 hypothetical protein FIU92_09595 [Ruegeria sp. THAF33]